MTALLTDNLPLLAGAPNGIKKLRELILELAVRGKLVPQDPNDEPASELLIRIAEEKARLVAEGKIKKQKPLVEISEEERPFEVPTTWAYARLSEIATKLTDGSHNPPKDAGSGFPMLSSRDVTAGRIRFDSPSRYLSADDFDAEESRTRTQPGDVLLTIVASLGRSAVVPIDAPKFALQRSVAVIASGLYPEFLSNLLNSPVSLKYFDAHAKGTAQKGIYLGKLGEYVTPVPPLSEQHRIVAKVDKLMALCDRLEAQQADADSAHTQLVQALLDSLTQASDADDFAQSWQRLAEHFHTLFTTESSIDALKQTLLQLAVMGKLVPQDPSDEPATELLKRNGIDSEAHALQGWAQAPLGYLGEVLGGSTPSKTKADFWNGDIPWVSPKDMKRPVIDDSIDHISAKALAETSLKVVPPKSLLMVVRGMILAHSFPVALTAREVTINQDMKALVPPEEISDYLLMYLQAVKPLIVGLVDRSSHGTCKLISEKLWSHNICLPPLAEQHRIVAKVDQLMALCDQLKTRLSEARQLHEQLASTLVEQAVA